MVDVSDPTGPPALPKIGSLNLNPIRQERQNVAPLSGDHDLATGDIPMSPRASSDQILMTPRTALGKKDTKRVQFTSAEELHGEGPVAIASNGLVHASIGVNGKLALWDSANSKLIHQVTLQLPAELEKKQDSKKMEALKAKPPRWLAFDCEGLTLGIHRPGVGLWLCRVKKEGDKIGEVTDALMLGDAKMSEKFAWCGFSSCVPGLLAVGTDGGRVMLFNPKTNKLTAQKDGKHPGRSVAVVAGDFLKDGRLAVASGERMKVSAPIGVDSDPVWETYAKFRISGMTSKIPIEMVSTTKSYDSTPGYLARSMGEPPYIAMTLGDKVVTIMDYSGAYKEEGFFIPLDYGHIVGMVWVDHEVVLIALANGYVVLVSAPLLMRQRKNAAASAHGRTEGDDAPAVTTKSMSTTRIFQNYLSACVELEGSPAVLGDSSLKVLRVDMSKWGTDECLSIAADIEIEGYDGRIGTSLNAIAVKSTGGARLNLALTSTGGLLHGFSLPGLGAAVAGA